MPYLIDFWRSSRKHIINIMLFVAGVLIVTAIWPHDRKDTIPEFAGSIMLISSCYFVLYLFLRHFRRELLDVSRKILFISLIIPVFTGLTILLVYTSGTELLYLIPFAAIPIIICTFFDSRFALFIFIITLMLCGFLIPTPFEFIFTSFFAGVAAIFSLTNNYRKGKLLIASSAVVISYCVIHFAVTAIHGINFGSKSLFEYVLFIGNGVIILMIYPVIALSGARFYFLSDTILLELSDISNPVLRRFAEEAPGSFQHSLQVANLAEEAVRVTGGNPLLARAGSLYHDIGKIINSGYFVENQAQGTEPHHDLSPVTSAELIINHVHEGVLLARQFRLPVQIIDFIRTHHGTTRAYFFYMKYLAGHSTDDNAERIFTYPGPKPFSREMAVVMMADAVEAASRTLERYTAASVDELVEKIIRKQEDDDQYSDSPLTFRDISEIKSVFRKRLLTMHHVRNVYPGHE